MKNIGLERLRKLADHLMRGKQGHARFDFTRYNTGFSDEERMRDDTAKCGTAGCAVGECPIVFPRQWKWDFDSDPILRIGPRTAFRSAIVFFRLDEDQANHLFIPRRQNPSTYGGVVLEGDATRQQVVSNIRLFIKLKQAGKI